MGWPTRPSLMLIFDRFPPPTLVYNRFLAGYITSVSIRFNSDRFNELSDVVLSLHTLGSRCATNKYFQIIGSIHDIESYFGIDNTASLTVQIVLCHSGHTSIILVWVSRNLFHIGWIGNYELFSANPIWTIPIGHAIFDPHCHLQHFSSLGLAKDPLSKSTATATAIAYNGIYNSVYTLGFNSLTDVYNFVITLELLALISIANATPYTHPPHNRIYFCPSPTPRFQIEIIHLHNKHRSISYARTIKSHAPYGLSLNRMVCAFSRSRYPTPLIINILWWFKIKYNITLSYRYSPSSLSCGHSICCINSSILITKSVLSSPTLC